MTVVNHSGRRTLLKRVTFILTVFPGLAAASLGPVVTYEAAHGGGYTQTARVQPGVAPASPMDRYCVVPQVLAHDDQEPDLAAVACHLK